MRRRVIAGNWKMYKTIADTHAFFAAFSPLVADAGYCDIVIAPPFTAISAAVAAAKIQTWPSVGRMCPGKRKGPSPPKFLPGCLWKPVAAMSSSGIPSDGSFLARLTRLWPGRLRPLSPPDLHRSCASAKLLRNAKPGTRNASANANYQAGWAR